MADRCNSIDPLALLIAYWATFGGGCDDIQPTPRTIGEVIRG